MAKQERKPLDWQEIDPASLTGEHATAYTAYKEAYRVAKEYKAAFEAGMQVLAPEAKRLVFGYNFGKLSVALDDAAAQPKAKGPVALSALLRRV